MLPVILLNVARYLTTSLRGPAQPYTNERASASQMDVDNFRDHSWIQLIPNVSTLENEEN